MDNQDFFETIQGQFIAGAQRYLVAAQVLCASDEWRQRGRLLQTPALHLLAHGAELLFKYPLIRQGMDPNQVRSTYGHDLLRLWSDDANEILRREVLEAADFAWTAARDSGKWPNDNFDEYPRRVLVKAVGDLAHLHGRSSSFALRYIIDGETLAPRPSFLIEVFGRVAERTSMNPAFLDD